MCYELLKTGDRVLNITNEFLSIERYDGTVELFPIYIDNGEICLNTKTVTTISYTSSDTSENTDEYVTDNGVHVINF